MPKAVTYNFTAHFIREDAGGYSVIVPVLPGCNTQGETFEEAFRNAQDAIHLYLESLADHGEPIPIEGETAVARVPVPMKERAPRV